MRMVWIGLVLGGLACIAVLAGGTDAERTMMDQSVNLWPDKGKPVSMAGFGRQEAVKKAQHSPGAARREIKEGSASPSDIEISPEHPPVIRLKSVNGISLYDTRDNVTDKLGDPPDITIVEDPYVDVTEIEQYPGMKIGFYGDSVQYVELPAGSGTLEIDGFRVNKTIEAISGLLGRPDYIAEDGIVFQRGELLLKLFIDSGKLTSIHYYPISST